MSVLVTGSLAYDYIMDFPDSFGNHILPDKIHMLNVSFIVDQLRKEFGGTAGNIAHTMQLLGEFPLIMATIGRDGQDYLDILKIRGLDTSYITKNESLYTASAHIVTDKNDNQITPFYPGALIYDDQLDPGKVQEPLTFATVSPTKKEAMIAYAKRCSELGIPFLFDPGQQVTAFSPQELMLVIGQSSILIGNDYEMALITQKTGWNGNELAKHVNTLITTLGDKGSVITTEHETIEIPAARAQSVEDPTGAGDAYRGGFLAGLTKGLSLADAGKIGSLAATYAVEHYGTQNHHYTLDEFKSRYMDNFQTECPL